jgi:hypothetical protein
VSAFSDAARAYSQLGWALVRADGKRPKGTAWQTAKPTDPDFAAGLWANGQDNIGAVLGPSHLVELDVDIDENPDGALLELLEADEFPRTPIARSGSGRLKAFFADPGGLSKVTYEHDRGKIELRVGPHFTLLPPSVHPETGRASVWLPGREFTVPPTPLADSVVKHFASLNGRGGSGLVVGEIIPDGEIDDTLFRFACSMRRNGATEEEIYAALVVMLARCAPGHTHTEKDCRRIAKSACKYPPNVGASETPTHPTTHLENRVAALSESAPDVGASGASLRSRDAPTTDALEPPTNGFVFESGEAFSEEDEASAEMVLGYGPDDAAAVAGGTVLVYGDGGAGKTTLTLDCALHLTTGSSWLGLNVPRALRVLVIENDGPRGRFRRKIRAKLAAWGGAPPGDRLVVLAKPWGETSLAIPEHRQALADHMREHDVDVLLAGPIVALGMIGGGTPDEVKAFEAHLAALRGLLERPLAVWLIHHENVRGQISGAWGRVPDTQIRLVGTGNGSARLVWDKTRDSETLHKTSWKLKWAPGQSFELDDTPDVTEDEIVESVIAAVLANPGASWNVIDKATKGTAETKRQVRDRLISSGALVNRGKGKGFALFVADDDPAPQLSWAETEQASRDLQAETGTYGHPTTDVIERARKNKQADDATDFHDEAF